MDTPDDIDRLLKEAQNLGGDAQDFAGILLSGWREEMEAAVRWQRSEGRTRVFQGEEPDVILAEVNAKTAEAREAFKGKLERLLEWARGRGA